MTVVISNLSPYVADPYHFASPAVEAAERQRLAAIEAKTYAESEEGRAVAARRAARIAHEQQVATDTADLATFRENAPVAAATLAALRAQVEADATEIAKHLATIQTQAEALTAANATLAAIQAAEKPAPVRRG